MDGKLDFEGLGRALLAHARLLVPAWLPGGSSRGAEYVCGNLQGGPGSSFSVNLETGRWADFANDALRGGDLISLYAAVEGIGQGEAAKILAEKIGYTLSAGAPRKPAPAAAAICKPPQSMGAPAMRHPHLGEAAMSWCYRDKDGSTLFYIARYNEDGGKQFVPWCWDADAERWVMKHWPAPRPLYGLDRLFAQPDKNVLIVEGEKAADAAAQLAPGYVVVSWPGGSSAWRKIDWSPLAGRRLLLWPDADRHLAETPEKANKHHVELGAVIPYESQPGPAAMSGIAGELFGKAAEIKYLDVGIDAERADGWDAADALAEGWSTEKFLEWGASVAKVYGPPAAPEEGQLIDPNAPEPEGGELTDAAPKNLYAEWEKLGVATTQNGSPICNVDNALRIIEGRKEFKELVWYDEFHKRYMTRFNFYTWEAGPIREWTDVDELNLTAFMQRQLGLRRISDDMIHKAAIVYAHQHLKCEPKDWMETLKWDGVGRCDDFFISCLGAEASDYTKAAAKNLWIGMIARIYRPGCQLDNMVVLEGAQGIGKTRALMAIGGDWYTSGKEAVTSNDFFMILHGRMLVEIAELDAFNRAETTRIKQVVTCSTDRYRAPYARGAQDHPRMSVFVATTNERAYLNDHTGARRFWPIACNEINLDKIREDREQLFAEAVARFKAGEDWYQMPLATLAEQESRRQVDEWERVVGEFLVDRQDITIKDVAEHLKIDMAKLDMVLQKRIGKVLHTLGWEKENKRGVGRVWNKGELPFKEPAPSGPQDLPLEH